MRHYHQHAYLSSCSASQRSFASSKGFSVSSGGKLFIPTNSPVGISSFVPHYIQPVPPTYVTEYEYAYTSPQSKLDFQRGKQAKQQTKHEELKKVKMVDKGVSTDQLAQWEKLSHLAAELNELCGDLLPQSLLADVHKVADSRVVSSQFEKVCSRLKDVVRASTEDSEDGHHDGDKNGNHQNGHKKGGVTSRAVYQPRQRGQQRQEREEATDTQQDRAMELCLAFIDCADDIKRCC